jgi:hypothetical protein
MKDPNDKKTIDGFADLVSSLEQTPARGKPGPKPQGERALTPAEKQKAYRDRNREKKKAAAAAKARGDRPTSSIIDLTTDFASLIAEKSSDLSPGRPR